MDSVIPTDTSTTPKHFMRFTAWLKESCAKFANDVGADFIKDLPEFSNQLRDEDGIVHEDCSPNTPNYPLFSSADIEFLSNDSIFVDEVSDSVQFDDYVYYDSDAAILIEQFPSLRMRLLHYSEASNIDCKLLMKRILFKLQDQDLILVHSLVFEDEDFLVIN